MNEELNVLFSQYKSVNPNITEEMFLNTYNTFGDQYLNDVSEELKKKRPADREWESAFNSTDGGGDTDFTGFGVEPRADSAVARPKFFGIGWYGASAFYGIGIGNWSVFIYREY